MTTGIEKIEGKKRYRCVHARCASKGNVVTEAHVHKYLPVLSLDNARREDNYYRQREGRPLTVAQRRQLRKAAGREAHRDGIL